MSLHRSIEILQPELFSSHLRNKMRVRNFMPGLVPLNRGRHARNAS